MTLLENDLGQIGCPALVRWEREDQVVPAGCLERFAEGISRSRGVIIDICGHVPYLEKSDQTIALYQYPLKSLDGYG